MCHGSPGRNALALEWPSGKSLSCVSRERVIVGGREPTSSLISLRRAVLKSEAPARARPQAMPERARGWAMAVGAEQPPWAQSSLHLRGPASAASARLQLARAINFLQAPDLAYSPKIEIVHRGNRTALFVSSDATRCADHYGMLRYGRLQRVVSRLQVKV